VSAPEPRQRPPTKSERDDALRALEAPTFEELMREEAARIRRCLERAPDVEKWTARRSDFLLFAAMLEYAAVALTVGRRDG
jgi:hypothetical protein